MDLYSVLGGIFMRLLIEAGQGITVHKWEKEVRDIDLSFSNLTCSVYASISLVSLSPGSRSEEGS